MKKIGILTFHDVVNYGAALQAYALQESIRKIGCQVEILDYHEQCAGMPNQHFSLFSRVYTKLKLLNSINYNKSNYSQIFGRSI